MKSGKLKVFLIVTIPTHLRVLMDAADLLRSSDRYEPVMLYYPSAVFDQNHANCQQAPHDAFAWTGSYFVSKTDYLAGNWRSASSAKWLPNKRLSRWLPNKGISRWLPDKGIYRRLAKVIPFLPSPTDLIARVRRAISIIVSVSRFFAGAYGILRSALFDLVQSLKSSSMHEENQKAYVDRGWLQRFLLRVFAIEWDSLSRQECVPKIGFRQRLIRLFSEGLFSGLRDQKTFHEGISELIKSENPALVVLPEANLFYNSQFVVRAAHLSAIPVAIVPFTIANTLEWAEAFFDVELYQANKGWNRLFAKAFPRWVLQHRGRRLILPPVHILGGEYFDMVPDIPWLINSGHADVIAAESQFMADYYLRAGIRKEKIHFTGALADDKLFSLLLAREQNRSMLGESHGVLMRERVILIGLPPDQFGAGKRQGCEFDSYEDLIRFMVGTVTSVSGSEATVLINLHPRIRHADVAWLATLGATIIDEPIESLVPLADVYVAVASATIRLGISCGIPIVNYDAYQYDYDDYKGLAGVCEVKSKHDYETVVDRLIHDQLFYSKIKAAQKATANNVCLVDGKAGERLLSLFDHLTANSAIA